MNKTSLKLVGSLIRNWYSEYQSLNYCGQYPYEVSEFGNKTYEVTIRPAEDKDFCSSILVEKVTQIANAACVAFHLSYEDGLVFTLH